MKTDWSDFKGDIKAVLRGNKVLTTSSSHKIEMAEAVEPTEPTPTAPVKVNKKTVWFMGLLALAVSLGITIALSDSNTQLTRPSIIAESKAVAMPTDDKYQRHEKWLTDVSTKMRILSAVSNNNWDSYYRKTPSNDLVFLGKNWKLSQSPPNLEKNETDEKFFQEWSQ
jgi:hypothetical protein